MGTVEELIKKCGIGGWRILGDEVDERKRGRRF